MSSNVTAAGLSGSKQMLKKWGLLCEPPRRYLRQPKSLNPRSKKQTMLKENWYSAKQLAVRYFRQPKSLNPRSNKQTMQKENWFSTKQLVVGGGTIASGLIIATVRHYWFERDDYYDFKKSKGRSIL